MRRFLNVSRPCYDKFHRCPGWAGGGIHFEKKELCDGGYVAVNYNDKYWKWKWQFCNKCNVRIFPYMTRWLDPGWWKWQIKGIPREFEYWKLNSQSRSKRRARNHR